MSPATPLPAAMLPVAVLPVTLRKPLASPLPTGTASAGRRRAVGQLLVFGPPGVGVRQPWWGHDWTARSPTGRTARCHRRAGHPLSPVTYRRTETAPARAGS